MCKLRKVLLKQPQIDLIISSLQETTQQIAKMSLDAAEESERAAYRERIAFYEPFIERLKNALPGFVTFDEYELSVARASLFYTTQDPLFAHFIKNAKNGAVCSPLVKEIDDLIDILSTSSPADSS